MATAALRAQKREEDDLKRPRGDLAVVILRVWTMAILDVCVSIERIKKRSHTRTHIRFEFVVYLIVVRARFVPILSPVIFFMFSVGVMECIMAS